MCVAWNVGKWIYIYKANIFKLKINKKKVASTNPVPRCRHLASQVGFYFPFFLFPLARIDFLIFFWGCLLFFFLDCS